MPDKLITAGVKHMKFWHRAGKSMARSILIRIYLKMVLSFQNALHPKCFLSVFQKSLIQKTQVALKIVIPCVVLGGIYMTSFSSKKYKTSYAFWPFINMTTAFFGMKIV